MDKPKQGDYAVHYGTYIDLVPEGDMPGQLRQQEQQTLQLYGTLGEEQGAYRYGAGKWSLKEVLGHVIDTERVMGYRLLRVARGDTTPLPGFDEQVFVANTDFNRRSLAGLTAEYRTVRAATVALLGGLTPAELQRAGTATNQRITACALAYIVAGHELHHMNIVRERYLPGLRPA